MATKAALTSGDDLATGSVDFRCRVFSDGPQTAQTAQRSSAVPHAVPSAIPSTWRSPTARQPESSISPSRRQACQALPSGCGVVALWEVDGMPHPAHPTAHRQPIALGIIPETCRSARAEHFGVKADTFA